MLVGKPYMHNTISQGLFFFVRHAPLPISPLCCLILRRGFRVYLQGKTKIHKYWYHLFTNWNPSNLQTTGSEFQNGIEPDVGVSFESGTERSEKIAREESRPFSFFFTIFITFRWWIYGFLILFSALPFSHLSLSLYLSRPQIPNFNSRNSTVGTCRYFSVLFWLWKKWALSDNVVIWAKSFIKLNQGFKYIILWGNP